MRILIESSDKKALKIVRQLRPKLEKTYGHEAIGICNPEGLPEGKVMVRVRAHSFAPNQISAVELPLFGMLHEQLKPEEIRTMIDFGPPVWWLGRRRKLAV